jgi:hypothetical protein
MTNVFDVHLSVKSLLGKFIDDLALRADASKSLNAYWSSMPQVKSRTSPQPVPEIRALVDSMNKDFGKIVDDANKSLDKTIKLKKAVYGIYIGGGVSAFLALLTLAVRQKLKTAADWKSWLWFGIPVVACAAVTTLIIGVPSSWLQSSICTSEWHAAQLKPQKTPAGATVSPLRETLKTALKCHNLLSAQYSDRDNIAEIQSQAQQLLIGGSKNVAAVMSALNPVLLRATVQQGLDRVSKLVEHGDSYEAHDRHDKELSAFVNKKLVPILSRRFYGVRQSDVRFSLHAKGADGSLVDLASVDSSVDKSECAQQCMSDASCVAFGHSGGQCRLYNVPTSGTVILHTEPASSVANEHASGPSFFVTDPSIVGLADVSAAPISDLIVRDGVATSSRSLSGVTGAGAQIASAVDACVRDRAECDAFIYEPSSSRTRMFRYTLDPSAGKSPVLLRLSQAAVQACGTPADGSCAYVLLDYDKPSSPLLTTDAYENVSVNRTMLSDIVAQLATNVFAGDADRGESSLSSMREQTIAALKSKFAERWTDQLERAYRDVMDLAVLRVRLNLDAATATTEEESDEERYIKFALMSASEFRDSLAGLTCAKVRALVDAEDLASATQKLFNGAFDAKNNCERNYNVFFPRQTLIKLMILSLICIVVFMTCGGMLGGKLIWEKYAANLLNKREAGTLGIALLAAIVFVAVILGLLYDKQRDNLRYDRHVIHDNSERLKKRVDELLKATKSGPTGNSANDGRQFGDVDTDGSGAVNLHKAIVNVVIAAKSQQRPTIFSYYGDNIPFPVADVVFYVIAIALVLGLAWYITVSIKPDIFMRFLKQSSDMYKKVANGASKEEVARAVGMVETTGVDAAAEVDEARSFATWTASVVVASALCIGALGIYSNTRNYGSSLYGSYAFANRMVL